MLLVRIVQSARTRSRERANSSALSAARQRSDRRSADRADTDTLSRVHVPFVPDIPGAASSPDARHTTGAVCRCGGDRNSAAEQ